MFETQDFYLSAYLSAAGLPIVHFFKESGLTTFAFEENSRLAQLVREYYDDKAMVSAIRYGNSLKNLKFIIHSNHYGQSITNYSGAK